jgi:hypothetical protein
MRTGGSRIVDNARARCYVSDRDGDSALNVSSATWCWLSAEIKRYHTEQAILLTRLKTTGPN